MRAKLLAATAAGLVLGLQAPGAWAQNAGPISPPKAVFGFDIGDDYSLANYTQLQTYWTKLAAESDRMKLVSIGKTAEGRDQLMAIVSTPENLKNLDRYQEISRKLAKAEGLTDAEAKALAKEGKAIVWIDGGLHATETVGAQQVTQMLYEMVSGNDPETLGFLKDAIILFAHANPDGMELVSNWYMRNKDPQKREMEAVPRLYQKYVGHDNNRDFYMSNQAENININRVLYREWFPQIVYNHHQTGPGGMVVFIPTFRDPFNYNLDPLAITGLDGVGAFMHERLIREDKAGSGRRSVATYSNWTNATLRSTALFHNSIGILTEISGSPTPIKIDLIPKEQLARNDLPMPIEPQSDWKFKQSIDYSISMNRAVLDYATRNKENLLFAFYKMGKNGVDKGARDTWTTTPKRIAALEAAAKAGPAFDPGPVRWGMGRAPNAVDPKLFGPMLRNPADRDPRGYIIPADQTDLPTAVAFVNVLIKGGVDVEVAKAPFTAGGKSYPAGSYVVKTGQAYRAHVLDMFEPQDHPDDFPFPGGAPIPPYDVAGYTPAYQMGIKFDRILDGFEAPTEKLPDIVAPPPGKIVGAGGAGFLISHEVNNAFIVKNRLLKAGKPVFWVKSEVTAGGKSFTPGAIWTPAGPGVRELIEKAARDTGVDAYALDAKPTGEAMAIKPVRIGLVDVYGGNMPSGWIRWIFEQFEFPYEVVYPKQLDAGGLAKKYDVLVFANDIVSEPNPRTRPQPKAEDIPAEFRPWLGTITEAKTVPQLDTFVRGGGTLIAIGSSTKLAKDLKLPVSDALSETGPDGKTVHLPRTKFFVPGAIMANKVDISDPLAYGMPEDVKVYYYNSPAFKVDPNVAGVRSVATFPGPKTLLSGWAWGQERLAGASSIVEADLGKGKVFLMGPEVTQRGQSHGTYKLFFNGLFYGPAAAAAPKSAALPTKSGEE
jgi:hypothetical protein